MSRPAGIFTALCIKRTKPKPRATAMIKAVIANWYAVAKNGGWIGIKSSIQRYLVSARLKSLVAQS